MLNIYKDEALFFSSQSKWLHPIFEFEDFLKKENAKNNTQPCSEMLNLTAHDSAIGKAAAVLLVRLGIKKMHGDLVSSLAVDYVTKTLGKDCITYDKLVDRLMCQTENILDSLTDVDEMYYILRQRADKVLGLPVKIENLTYKYGKIKNLNLEVPSGGRLMILGENGTGKTTLLRLICGIYKSDSGSILIGGKPLSQLEKYTIGYIPQLSEFQEEQNFDLTVEEVIGLGIAKGPRLPVITDAMKRTGCEHLAGRKFSVLSGGEKQKVSLARCLAQKAKLLLLDEPTANLDAENRKMVIDTLHSLSISEIPTIIMVTHDKDLTALKKWEVLNLG